MTRIRNRHFKTKRLRKKYHQGEFRQLGFEVEASFITPFPKDACESIQEAWDETNVLTGGVEKILCFMESIGLEFGGGTNNKTFGFFVCKDKGSCTTEEIQKVVEFIKELGLFKDIVVGPLKDAWYGN